MIREKIIKPASSFSNVINNQLYFYLPKESERRKLNKFVTRTPLLCTTSKIVMKRNEISNNNITFGRRGAMLFTESVIDFYNKTISEKEECEEEDTLQEQPNQLLYMKRYLNTSYNLKELTEIQDICKIRIDVINKYNKQLEKEIILKRKDNNKKPKKRITPELVH